MFRLPDKKGSGAFVCAGPVCSAANTAIAPLTLAPVNVAFSQKLEWFSTIRGRVGYTFAPTVLGYVTGGAAIGGINTNGVITGFAANGLASADRLQRQRYQGGLDGRRRRGSQPRRQLDRQDRISLHGFRQGQYQRNIAPQCAADPCRSRFQGYRQYPARRRKLQIRSARGSRSIDLGVILPPAKSKAPASSGVFLCAGAKRDAPGGVVRPAESGLRWGANRCNMERF